MKEANCETETLYHVIECRDLQEKEAATTGDKKTMLQVIGGWYKDGFRFLESFEFAKMHYGVFTKDVEVAMSTAPTEWQDAATTAQEASDPMTKEFFLDYEELKSLREANKRQGAIIDDLLQTNSELKAKADSLVEHPDSKSHVDRLIDEKADLRSMLKQIVSHSLKAEMDDEQFRKFARDNANHVLEQTKPKKG